MSSPAAAAPIGRFPIPTLAELPEDIRPMLRMQAFELRHGYFPTDAEHFVARIGETIRHHVARHAQYPLTLGRR